MLPGVVVKVNKLYSNADSFENGITKGFRFSYHPKPPKPKKAEQTTQKNDLSRFPSIHLSPNDIPKPFRSYIPGTYTPLSFTYIPSGVLRLLYISPLTGSR